MVKKIIGFVAALVAIVALAACSSQSKFESMPVSLDGGGNETRYIMNMPDPQKKLRLDYLEENGADKETQQYIIERLTKIQPVVIKNSDNYFEYESNVSNYYGDQRFIYVVSDRYLKGTKEGEEFKKTALDEMIKLKEQYEKLTGEKVTSSN